VDVSDCVDGNGAAFLANNNTTQGNGLGHGGIEELGLVPSSNAIVYVFPSFVSFFLERSFVWSDCQVYFETFGSDERTFQKEGYE